MAYGKTLDIQIIERALINYQIMKPKQNLPNSKKNGYWEPN
jgi:hypothetical protein